MFASPYSFHSPSLHFAHAHGTTFGRHFATPVAGPYFAHTAPTFSFPAFAPAPLATPAPTAGTHLQIPKQQHKPGEDVCLTLTYWPVRGLGSPIRILLSYADACFEENLITDPESWFGPEGLKGTLREENPFINLPYFEDGALVLAQSNSILRHIARKFNLIGCTEITAAKSDMLLDQLYDFRQKYGQLSYAGDKENFEAAKGEFLRGFAAEQLEKFAEWLKLNNTGYLVENHPTVADFVLFELLDVLNLLEPGILATQPALAEFHARILAEPRLQKYFESDAAKYPCNGPSAHWNA